MLGSRIISASIRLTTGGKRVEDVTSGMRLFNRKVISRYCKDMHYSPEPDTLAYLLSISGFKIEEVQVDMKERYAGVRLFKQFKLIKLYGTNAFLYFDISMGEGEKKKGNKK